MHWVDRDREAAWTELVPADLNSGDPRIGGALHQITSDNPALGEMLRPWLGEGPAATEAPSSDAKPRITSICSRPLDFYKAAPRDSAPEPPLLLEFRVERQQREAAGSEVDRLYFVAYRPAQPDQPPGGKSDSGYRLLHLNGSSPPIHQLNAATGEIDMARSKGYCDFFCAFTSAEDGPFSVIHRTDEFEWAKWPDDIKLFEGVRIAELKKNVGADRVVTGPADVPLDTFGSVKVSTLREVADLGDYRPINDEVLEEFATANVEIGSGAKLPELRQQLDAARQKPGTAWAVVISYGRRLFKALMVVRPQGVVDMLFDVPLHPSVDMYPIAQKVFSDRLGIPLCRSLIDLPAPKRETGIVEKLQRIRRQPQIAGLVQSLSAGPAPMPQPIDQFDGVIETALDEFRGHTLEFPISFTGVDFFEEVNFENTTFSGNVRFFRCRFLRQVNFRNAQFLGSLVFDRCIVTGLPGEPTAAGQKHANSSQRSLSDAQRNQLTTCLDLDGAVVKGDLDILRSTLEGSVTMRRATVSGRTRLQGSDVQPLYDPQLKDKSGKVAIRKEFTQGGNTAYGVVAVDMRHSRFERGLEIAARFPDIDVGDFGSLQDRSVQPTLVVGSVRGEHTQIGGSLIISGLITCNLQPSVFALHSGWQGWTHVTFANARISGGVQMWSTGEGALDLWRVARTIVGNDLSFSQATIDGDCDLRGLWIGGDLTANDLRCTGRLNLSALSQRDIDYWSSQFPTWRLSKIVGYALPEETLYKEPNKSARLAKFGRTRIIGAVELAGVELGSLFIDGAHIGGAVLCDRGRFGQISANISLSPLEDSIHASSVKDLISVLGSGPADRLDGLLGYLRDNLDTIDLRATRDGGAGLLTMRTRAARIQLRDAVVRGRISLAGMWLTEEGHQSDAQAAADARPVHRRRMLQEWAAHIAKQIEDGRRAPTWTPPPQFAGSGDSDRGDEAGVPQAPRIIIENTLVEGPLYFHNPDYCRDLALRENNHTCQAYKTLLEKINGTAQQPRDTKSLAGDMTAAERLNLAKLLYQQMYTGHDCAWIGGRVQIVNSTIKGRLDISGLTVGGQVEIKDVDLASDLLAATCRSEAFPGAAPDALYLVAQSLDLEMLRCGGDAQLAGLVTPGDLTGRNMVVKGHLELLNSRKDPMTWGRWSKLGLRPAFVGGCVELTGVDINWLQAIAIPSGSSNSGSSNIKWTLERSTIGRLNFSEPLPQEIDLRGLDCRRISLPGEKEGEDRHWRDELLKASNLLDRGRPSKETAALFERLLRVQGRIPEANRVHAGTLGPLRGPFFRLLASLWGALALFVIGLLLVEAAFLGITAHEDNWDPPPLATLMERTRWNDNGNSPGRQHPALSPSSATINLTQSIVKAVEIGLPIVALSARDNASDPKLRENGDTIGFGRWFTVPVPPAALASLISLLGWIIWPLLILSVSGFARRE
jgi:hypothetical protein